MPLAAEPVTDVEVVTVLPAGSFNVDVTVFKSPLLSVTLQFICTRFTAGLLVLVNEKLAMTGASFVEELETDTLFEVDPVAPSSSVTVNETVYVPAVEYVHVGFFADEVVPFPKFQLQPTTEPSVSELLSVKVAVNSFVVKVKPAVGG